MAENKIKIYIKDHGEICDMIYKWYTRSNNKTTFSTWQWNNKMAIRQISRKSKLTEDYRQDKVLPGKTEEQADE